MKWSAERIAGALARQVFQRRHLVVVPNTYWPGCECDLLVVRHDLRLMDVEIKISRSDFKADRDKDKWFHPWDWRTPREQRTPAARAARARPWPPKIWKHYYCLPEEIWKPELEVDVQPMSGILLMRGSEPFIRVHKQAKANPGANPVSPEDVQDIARLTSLRLWDAKKQLEKKK